MHLSQYHRYFDQRLAKIHLCLTWTVLERHEYLIIKLIWSGGLCSELFFKYLILSLAEGATDWIKILFPIKMEGLAFEKECPRNILRCIRYCGKSIECWDFFNPKLLKWWSKAKAFTIPCRFINEKSTASAKLNLWSQYLFFFPRIPLP